MATKRFCDSCGDELTKDNEFPGVDGIYNFDIEVRNKVKGQVMVTMMKTDVCKYCILSAIHRHDDRPNCV